MRKTNRQVISYIVNAVILLLLFILRYTGLATLTIGQASPITLIPFVAAFALFYGELKGAALGFAAGALMDSCVTTSSFFNTLIMLFIGLVCGILANYYLNKNIKAAICLSLGASFFYLFARLIIFYSFRGISVDAEYYGYYFIPTVFYTAIFIIPFYFLEKKLREI